MTRQLDNETRQFNLYLSGDITITSNHHREGQNFNVNRKFGSHSRKGYVIKKSTRRNLTSSAFLLFLKKQYKIVFLTLTFPEKIEKGVKVNPMLNSFLTNMKKTYGMGNFLWTRENTKKGQPHFHLLADLPYQPIQKINSAWCSAIGMYSGCAVRLPEENNSIVDEIDKVCRYTTKYLSKTVEGYKKPAKEYFPERCYSTSYKIKSEPVKLSWFDMRQLEEDEGKNLKFRYYDYCTCIKIWDFFKKSDYYVEFLGNYSENDENLHENENVVSNDSRRGLVSPALSQLKIEYG